MQRIHFTRLNVCCFNPFVADVLRMSAGAVTKNQVSPFPTKLAVRHLRSSSCRALAWVRTLERIKNDPLEEVCQKFVFLKMGHSRPLFFFLSFTI